ncbi:MAG TPA: DUF2141 domain-containing protein [Candidatus Binataceae bacterium]|nr:DUF2141 domain-containing protein [Candidatus Binataceae bacterium]
MKRRDRIFTVALGALALAGSVAITFGAAARAGDASASVPPGDIRVNFLGCPNTKGKVKCAIYNSPDGFPTDRSKITQSAASPVTGDRGVCVFKGLPPGNYAVAAFQDEDGTGKMRKNMLGIPQEVYGFSNDARNSLSAPSFDQAAFKYPGGTMDLTIHGK